MAQRLKLDKKRAESIGQRLARLRRERGLTQVELAAKLGITQSVVSLYELGEVGLHGEVIIRLARVLHASADEILGLKIAKGNGSPKSVRSARLVQQIEGLPAKDRHAILRTIAGFLASRGAAASR